jgi:hypothetical protein
MGMVRAVVKNLRNRSNLTGAEIGVGGSVHALQMLKHLDIKRLYLIDPFISYGPGMHGVFANTEVALRCKEDAQKRLESFSDKIVWIFEYSDKAVNKIQDEELDFVYIDGNHRYEYVKKDIELYYPKVKKGGLISGHDYKKNEPGVIKAVHESFASNKITTMYRWEWWVVKD